MALKMQMEKHFLDLQDLLPPSCPCCQSVPVAYSSERIFRSGYDWIHRVKFECGAAYYISFVGLTNTEYGNQIHRNHDCSKAQDIAEKLQAKRSR